MVQRHSSDRPRVDALYLPTSLGFINWPTPVEPQSLPQQHLNSSKSLTTGKASERLPLIRSHDLSTKSSTKRRPSIDAGNLDLPRLPLRRPNKRFRIPPTLSGLHHPPPDAGLLPSISVEKPRSDEHVTPLSAKITTDNSLLDGANSAVLINAAAAPSIKAATSTLRRRNRWSEEETSDLLRGVARFGIGNWTKILKHDEYSFINRTAIDLKDRFRICCPDEYLGATKRPPRKSAEPPQTSNPSTIKSDRKSTVELQSLGIDGPFMPTSRRKRHGYTAAEDAALLKGFEKYGKSWKLIRRDAELGLGHRKSTDLRDRFRTRYPTRYAEAGLAPRPDDFGKPSRPLTIATIKHPDSSGTTISEAAKTIASASNDVEINTKQLMHITSGTGGPKSALIPMTLSIPYDDIFFGTLDEQLDNGEHAERITLDRGILDWPSDQQRFDRTYADLGRATATASARHDADDKVTMTIGTRHPGSGMTSAALPPLAVITSRFVDNDDGGQLELPSITGFDGIDHAGRSVGQFLAFDELLS